jgi:hypothetical protein
MEDAVRESSQTHMCGFCKLRWRGLEEGRRDVRASEDTRSRGALAITLAESTFLGNSQRPRFCFSCVSVVPPRDPECMQRSASESEG